MEDVALHLDATEHHVRADPGRLQQIFWNVLSNADKFTPAGEPISVRTSNTRDGSLLVEITDTGVGIAPDVLPRVFDAFQQGDDSLTRSFGGMGLGLTITRAWSITRRDDRSIQRRVSERCDLQHPAPGARVVHPAKGIQPHRAIRPPARRRCGFFWLKTIMAHSSR